MALIRAMVIQKGTTGLPEDVYVNTWHFVSGAGQGTYEEEAQAAANNLDGFYDQIKGFLSSVQVSDVEYRMYNLADPQPREPLIFEASWQPTGSGAEMPTEVATCLSFYKDRNLPRNRGRLYIGPHPISVSAQGRPSPVFRTALAAAATSLIDIGLAPGSISAWALYSPTDDQGKIVTNGWVDNAFDTQRRRGEAPTERTLFEATP